MTRRLGAPFARVWSASTISNLGDGVFGVALALLAATLTRDPFAVSLVAFAGQLPWLLFSLFSGALGTAGLTRQLSAQRNHPVHSVVRRMAAERERRESP